MLVVKGRNANQILPEMMHVLSESQDVQKRDSRNGPVLQFVVPVTIQYTRPLERVVFWPERDANPFFHLFESLWMLAGRNDVAYVRQFSSQMGQFSDDGETFHGAYGHRWKRHFSAEGGIIDQVATIIAALKRNPDDRRQVLQMWDATSDLGRNGKDLPCNLLAVFNRDHTGALNMSVSNRSNDIIWGALGANCVHFSILQEYIAASIGCPVGQYWQISANMHGYTELNPVLNRCLPLKDKSFPSNQCRTQDPYEAGLVEPYPLMSTSPMLWDEDNVMFLALGHRAMGYRDPFFRRVASPLANAYALFSNREDPDRFKRAIEAVQQAHNCDWKLACNQWLVRRMEAAQAKAKKLETAEAA